MGRAKSPPTELLDLASDALSAPLRWREVAWRSGVGAVWEVAGEAGKAIVKAHAGRRTFQQEVHAYRAWAPAMAGEAPALLATHDAKPYGLLLQRLPGEPVGAGPGAEGAGPDAADLPGPVRHRCERELHRAAGAWLARWHAQEPPASDARPLSDAIASRCEAWSQRARAVLPARTIDEVARGIDQVRPALVGALRVPCHRDFTPRNWLARLGAWVGVIDFEHARADVALVDALRLWCYLWPRRPDLREAFEEGYGRRFDQDDEAVLRRLAGLEGVATVA